MTLAQTKAQLEKLVEDPRIKVISLSGRWGTGKTFMWNSLKKSSANPEIHGALYASFFGLSSLNQLHVKLMQSAFPSDEKASRWIEKLSQGAGAVFKALEGIHKSLGALSEVGPLLAPSILDGKLIVLDDLERKDNKLHINEILGFIDEYSNRYSSRFLIILNSDKLDDVEIWNRLREKVIDHELFLNTTSEEAFDIAQVIVPSPFADHIRAAVKICGLSNIRIISKIISVVNQVLYGHHELSASVLARVIPSTVLFASIYFKGIEDAPTFEFVLSQNPINEISDYLKRKENKKLNEELTEDDIRLNRWKSLLMELKIIGCDEYEKLVTEFLQSGLLDSSKIQAVIARYVGEEAHLLVQAEFNNFYERFNWDPEITEEELAAEARRIGVNAGMIDVYSVTSFHRKVASLPGGDEIGETAITTWINKFKETLPMQAPERDFFQREVHPRIREVFSEINIKVREDTTLLEVCDNIHEKNGWGSLETQVMHSATVEEIETLLRSYKMPEFKRILLRMLDLTLHKNTYINHFGPAMDNFIMACRNIVNDGEALRRGRIITELFTEFKAGKLLEPEKPPLAEESQPSGDDPQGAVRSGQQT